MALKKVVLIIFGLNWHWLEGWAYNFLFLVLFYICVTLPFHVRRQFCARYWLKLCTMPPSCYSTSLEPKEHYSIASGLNENIPHNFKKPFCEFVPSFLSPAPTRPSQLVKLITQDGLSGEKGGTLLTNESESQTRLLLRPNEFSGRRWRGGEKWKGRMARKRKLPSRLS